MKGERALAPLILTAAIITISRQWPQSLWRWVYIRVHINNAQLSDPTAQTSGQLTNTNPGAAPPPFGKTWNSVLQKWINMPAPGTYSTPKP